MVLPAMTSSSPLSVLPAGRPARPFFVRARRQKVVANRRSSEQDKARPAIGRRGRRFSSEDTMRYTPLLVALLSVPAVWAGLPAALADDNTSGQFFNGKDLDGWEGLTKYWSVKEGALVGYTPEDPKHNTFLCSKKKYSDFELKFKVRLKDGVGNSGVQIRSRLVDDQKFIVAGPQADIGQQFWGSLYGERFGGMMKQSPAEVVRRVVKQSDFNDYSIRCVGKHVTIKINGETMVDDDFPRLPDEGIIAWQLHAGFKSMEVTFKNIEFKDLSKREEKK
jgi:hypothetical protein